ncbi:MAG: hypothetical protein J7M08_02590 [Planctomycetes bacterium]|nr:hypothetical protein [Planctomycetota bacterium]
MWKQYSRVVTALSVGVAVFLFMLAFPLVGWAQGKSEDALKHVIEVQNRHTARLLAKKGVVGTAACPGAIIVLVENSDAAKHIPKELDGVAVHTGVSGKILAMGKINPKTRFARPAPIGVSTGNEGECSAGTIACRVTDGTNVYALSNNHVYAVENQAPIGSRILQPGLYDTGCTFDPENVIGTLHAFRTIVFDGESENQIDAAIALCTTEMLDNGTPSNGYGTPQSATVAAEVGQKVMKYGRSTGMTYGNVTGVNAIVKVDYTSGVALFVDQIIVESKKPFIQAGDSGSLMVTDSDKSPVGLLFAGNQTGKLAVANPIDLVLAAFGVTIDDSTAPVTDVAVTEVSAPASVLKGKVVDVDVVVKNVGNQDVPNDIVVTLSDQTDGVTIATKTIVGGLSAGAVSAVTFPWNTGAASVGQHTLKAVHDYADDDAGNNSKSRVISVTEEAAISVTAIDPNTTRAGATINVTVTGSGFASGAELRFENGDGSSPKASNVAIVDSATITATVSVKRGGPRRNRVWDVVVTNPDGSSGILPDGFTVTR